MDLGIAGKTAIVCASRSGLGRACAEALAQEGVHVVINGRDADRLEETARELRKLAKAEVMLAIGDVTTNEGRDALLAAAPAPDILINNNGGPAPRNFADIADGDWISVLEANMIAPLLLTKAVIPSMKAQKFGRIINI